jgi:hypothetical protein
VRISCVVLRDSYEEKTAALVDAVVDDDFGDGADGPPAETLFGTIREAVTEWIIETDEGRAAYADSCKGYNIGDLALDLGSPALRERLANRGIQELEVRAAADDSGHSWSFDDLLVDPGEVREESRRRRHRRQSP